MLWRTLAHFIQMFPFLIIKTRRSLYWLCWPDHKFKMFFIQERLKLNNLNVRSIKIFIIFQTFKWFFSPSEEWSVELSAHLPDLFLCISPLLFQLSCSFGSHHSPSISMHHLSALERVSQRSSIGEKKNAFICFNYKGLVLCEILTRELLLTKQSNVPPITKCPLPCFISEGLYFMSTPFIFFFFWLNVTMSNGNGVSCGAATVAA